jgi:hypothetical protein
MLSTQSLNLSKPAYGRVETRAILSIGNTTLHKIMKSGELRAVKCGRRTLFLATDIVAFLASLSSGKGR